MLKIHKLDYYISSNVFSKPQTPLRNVSNFEIELYSTGNNISVVNNKKYSQKIGNILVAKPNDKRYSIGSFECFCVHFSCDDPQISAALSALPTVFMPNDNAPVKKVFLKMLSAQNLDTLAKELFLRGSLLELISLLLSEKQNQYQGKYRQYIPLVLSACEYMEKNLQNHITLSDIAASANLSVGFFHKVFKEIKGETPNEYLLKLRIEKAQSLLQKTTTALAEIAILCGFQSQGYFNFVFKKTLGITPREYRIEKQVII